MSDRDGRSEASSGSATDGDPADLVARTLAVYDERAEEWARVRSGEPDRSRSFAATLAPDTLPPDRVPPDSLAPDRVPPDRVTVDLGCGPGWNLADLPRAVGLDASAAMLAVAATHAPGHPLVRADLRHLPLRDQRIGAAFAKKSFVHVDRRDTPMALRDLHRCLAPSATAYLSVQMGDADLATEDDGDDDFGGRAFSKWPEELLDAVLHLAGFAVTSRDTSGRHARAGGLHIRTLRRETTVPSTLGSGMDLLIVGVNPSPASAAAGIGFARPGNRFWPAVLKAGLSDIDRDPARLLHHGRVGMTDFSKMVSVRADEVPVGELQAGLARLHLICSWLRPGAVAVLGVGAWRQATGNRTAALGFQDTTIGGRPVYVMPNPSGLNAHTNVADMAGHLRAAVRR